MLPGYSTVLYCNYVQYSTVRHRRIVVVVVQNELDLKMFFSDDDDGALEDPFDDDDDGVPGSPVASAILAERAAVPQDLLGDYDAWTPATVSTSAEYRVRQVGGGGNAIEMVGTRRWRNPELSSPQAFARDVLRLWQRSLSLRVFSASLALWAGLYFIVVGFHHSNLVGGGLVPAKDYGVDDTTPGLGKSEYDIGADRRGHWALSLCHSAVALAGSTHVLLRSWNMPWWKYPNTAHPRMVVLVAFSGSYFLVDSNFVLSEVGYLVHHLVSLTCFLVSLMSGQYIKLVCVHLFFAELGNIAFIAEHIFYVDGAWGRWVTLWFCASRFAWVGAIMMVQWVPMCCRRRRGQEFATWKWVDVFAFVPSLMMCLGSLVYAFKFLEHEMGWNTDWSSEELAR